MATIEYNAVLHIAPFAVLLNSQFFRPTANGRIAFSARLLSIGTLPSSRNVLSDDGEEKTLDEISDIFDITRERVRQIENKALRRLRESKITRKLCCYLQDD